MDILAVKPELLVPVIPIVQLVERESERDNKGGQKRQYRQQERIANETASELPTPVSKEQHLLDITV